MVRHAMAFLAGNMGVHWLITSWLSVLVVFAPVLLLFLFSPRFRWIGAAGLGAALAAVVVSERLDTRWPLARHNEIQRLEVVVDGLARERHWGGVITEARVLRWPDSNGPSRVSMTWPGDLPVPKPGERWMITGTLRAPFGRASPGAFDTERYAINHGVDARVRVSAAVMTGRLHASLSRIRERTARSIEHAVGEEDAVLLSALLVGDRRGMRDQHWQTLQRTGTGHLMAISGMHVGMVAAAGASLAGVLCWCFPTICRVLARRQIAAMAGWLLALTYSAMAGFSLPTVRAMLMLSVVLAIVMLRRSMRAVDVLSVVLVVVLILDPLASLSASFWLSFGAVAMLLHIASATHHKRWLAGLLAVQWRMPLLMAPLVSVLFGQVSLIAPLANLVAVPVVTVLILPAALLGLALYVMAGYSLLLDSAAWLLAALFSGLDRLASLDFAAGYLAARPFWLTVLLVLAVAGLVLPWGWRRRLLFSLMAGPWLLYTPDRPAPGDWWLTVLDVGQGSAVVVETADQVLLYDVGAAWPGGSSEAERVILPWLRQRGWGKLDWLVVSHADHDHAGGLAALLDQIDVDRSMGSGFVDDRATPLTDCRRGMGWRMTGVEVSVLHPRPGLPYLGNDSSCVLEVSGRHGRLWLMGDVGHVVERRLLTEDLGGGVDVLLAGHHGSRNSSSAAFVQAVGASVVVFNAGYQNRFDMPDSEVLARFDTTDAQLINTGHSGSVRIRFQDGAWQAEGYRDRIPRWWRHRPALPQ